MANTRRTGASIDSEAVATELLDLGEVSERARLAAYGLSAPLLVVRAGQMDREIARIAAERGADDPEVAERTAARDAHAARTRLVAAELGRVRVTPVVPAAGNAALRGRVTRSGTPVADAKVVIEGGDRIVHACTDAQGGYALQVLADTDLNLSVRTSDGETAFRDTSASSYAPGQQAEREIDLDGAKPPCDLDDPPKTVAVPPLVGEKPETARAALDKAGLKLGNIGEAPVAANQVGLVVKQAPEAGSVVAIGSPVDIVVGITKPVTVDVPKLVGEKPETARKLLAEAGLALGKVGEAEAPEAQAGLVIAQAPEAGKAVAPGGAVDITIGLAAPKTVDVPKLIGEKEAAVPEILKKAGLVLGKTGQAPNANVGLVIGQAPDAGTAVAPGSAVDIVVGSPMTTPDTVTVPPLTGQTPDVAKQLLARVKLVLGKATNTPSTTANVGLVVSQTPAAGAAVAVGSAVDIGVGAPRIVVNPGIPGRPVASPRQAPKAETKPAKQAKPAKPRGGG